MQNTIKEEYRLSLIKSPEEAFLEESMLRTQNAIEKILSIPIRVFKQNNQKILINALLKDSTWRLSIYIRDFFDILNIYNDVWESIDEIIYSEWGYLDARKKYPEKSTLYSEILQEMEKNINLNKIEMEDLAYKIRKIIQKINSEFSLDIDVDLSIPYISHYSYFDNIYNEEYDWKKSS